MSEEDGSEPAPKQVTTWRFAMQKLQEVRHESIRNANTADVIEQMEEPFNAALKHSPPKPTSGLIEQQNIFRKIRK
ncbi:MAG: hypothetical protein AAF558_05780 [Verrucomicrobiota bacterium]